MAELKEDISKLAISNQLKIAINYTKKQWPTPNDSEAALIQVMENALEIPCLEYREDIRCWVFGVGGDVWAGKTMKRAFERWIEANSESTK